MTASEILHKYIEFFKKQNHVQIENSSLVPLNDPTTLFTSSGMQPLVPFLLGEKHPQGVRLVNVQNCFRAQDIDEIGDNRHTTFFRMLGNWSLGDYFKKEQLRFLFEFLTDELGLDPNKLYVTVFSGFDGIEKDNESIEIWEGLFKEKRINPDDRIFSYGVEKNWWSRSGTPDKMPIGEPGGPDSEVFYDFGEELGLHEVCEKTVDRVEPCHVNCDCGRYLEIGNSVFMQFIKSDEGFSELPQKNVDFGGGLERLVAATENKQDIFQTSLLSSIIRTIEQETNKDYKSNSRAMRIIADHLIAAVFIASAGVYPSNKEQGYILRRLVRRTVQHGEKLGIKNNFTSKIALSVIDSHKDTDPQLEEKKDFIFEELEKEENKFRGSLKSGVSQALRELEELQKAVKFIIDNPFDNNLSLLLTKDGIIDTYLDLYQADLLHELMNIAKNSGVQAYYVDEPPKTKFKMSEKDSKRKSEILDYFSSNRVKLNSKWAFRFVTTYGVPLEILQELGEEKDLDVDMSELDQLKKQHQELSRKGAERKFAGGLADSSEVTVKGHTATHLMHQALRDVLGNSVHQTGSNITPERVRFDFKFDRKLTDEEIKKVKEIVSLKIKEDLPVHFEIMPLQKAKDIGAIGLFDEKYGNDVKVYFVGDYSKEFCGGPHVEHTSQIQSFVILKEEGVARGVRRIYAKVT